MYTNLKKIGEGGFGRIGYWSSSTTDSSYIWYYNFEGDGGYNRDMGYDFKHAVRACRAF
jgi:hypothetical protein